MLKTCKGCGIQFSPLGARSQCCSVRCRLLAGSKLNPVTGCREWNGAVGSHGYGALNVGGEIFTSHRLAYELEHGAIPSGTYVCHHCDNRRCIEQSHLFVGTSADNAQDMAVKGRHWSKGRVLPEEFRARLRVPKKVDSRLPGERSAAVRKAWRTRRGLQVGARAQRLAKEMREG